MKQVKLSLFLKTLAARGIDLTGCMLADSRSTYQFIGMDSQNVKVRYGRNMERTGHMSAWLKADSILWKPSPGNRVRSIHGDTGSIVIKFSDMVRGY